MPSKTDPATAAAGTVKRKISRRSATTVANVPAAAAATPEVAVVAAAVAAPEATSEQQPPLDRGSAVSIRRAFYVEEEGADDCAAAAAADDGPLVAFAATKASLLTRLSEVARLKAASAGSATESESQASRLEALRTGCMTDLMIMKRLNREAQFRLKRARELTASCKMEADSRHLQLQNLLYECRHLQREITRCQDFRSRHEAIGLAPLDQFASESGANSAELSEHECTLARLRWELEQRERLARQLRSGKREAAAVQTGIAEKRRRLESLAPLLEAVAKAAEPVEAALGLDSGPGASASARWKAEATARLLPAPLYLLYCQLSAYAESGCLGDEEADVPSAMLVEIVGDRDEATSIRQAELDRLKAAAAAAASASSSEAAQAAAKAARRGKSKDELNSEDQEDDDEDDVIGKKKKKNKKTKKSKAKSGGGRSKDDDDEAGDESGEEAIRQLLTPHPLSVRLSLTVPNWPGRCLLLSFHYLPACRVVTVRGVSIEPSPPSTLAAEDIGDGAAAMCGNVPLLLDCLFPGDDARAAPGYAVRHALAGASDDYLWRRRRDVGLAYVWAQRLAGIVCLTTVAGSGAAAASSAGSLDVVLDAEASFLGVADCVDRLRRRADARLQLLVRLADLTAGHGTVSSKISSGLPPVAHCVMARAWQRVTYDAYCELPHTARLRQLVSPADLFFTAAVRCGGEDQKIAALALCVPVDYPDRLPVFGVGVQLLTSSAAMVSMVTCAEDLDLHEIEAEVNVHPTDLLPTSSSRQDVLPLQVHRLMLALEVYFNAGGGRDRGGACRSGDRRSLPTRVRPYRFSPGADMFVHRP